MQVIPFEKLTRPVSQRFVTLLLLVGISWFVDCCDVRAQSCSANGQTLGAYVQYQTVYADLSKCCFPEYTNLDLPRIHMYHTQRIVGDYGYHYTNDFTEATNWSGGSDGRQWEYHAGVYSEHDNTTRNFDFTENRYVRAEITNYCFYTNSCSGDLSTDNEMTDSRYYHSWSSVDGEESDSASSSSVVSGTVTTNDCCISPFPCNPNGHDVAYGFVGSWSDITHVYNYYSSGSGGPTSDPDKTTSSTNTGNISCLTVHRALTQIDTPIKAESDFSVTNTSLPPLCPSCSSDAFVDSTHDVFNYTLSYEYTDEELSNHIVGLMGDFSGSWYTPDGSGNEFYKTTAYSMIDGDHVHGQWQPTQEGGSYPVDAEMQKMKYRIVIPNTEAWKRYQVSWDLITYDFTTGVIETVPHIVYIDGTGESDQIYAGEEIVNPPHWDDSRDFFGGVVATWVDNLAISETSENLAGAGPGSLSWSGNASGCATCGSARSALQHSPYGALAASFALGNALGYGSAGNLEILARVPDVNLATPKSIIYPDGIPSIEAIRLSGVLRQVNAPQALVDIVTLDSFSYELRYYLPSQVGSLSGGVYSVTGSPFVTWTIQNPDASTNTYNRLQITETRGSDSRGFLYTYNPTNSVWTLTRPDNSQEEIATGFTNNVDWITLNVTNTVRSPLGVTNFQEIRVYQRPIGIQPVSVSGSTTNRAELRSNPQMKFYLTTNIVNPGSNAKVTTYSYYDNYTSPYAWGAWFHSTIPPVKYIKRSDGTWEYFAYNAQNVTDHVTPFGDAAAPTSGAPSYSTSRHTVYSEFDGGDFLTYAQDTVQEDKAHWTTHISFTTNLSPGVHFYGETDGTQNYHTITGYFTNGFNAGRLQSVQKPDGTLTLYAYDIAADATQTNTVWSGAPNSDKTAVVDGTKTVTIMGPVGQIISYTQTDIRSGITLANDVYGNYDSLSRPQLVTHMDGTTEQKYYSCCGIDYTVDRDGVTTQYYYDDAKRQVATFRNGITTSNLLDSVGRILKTVRIGTDNSQIVLGQWQYDLSGTLIRQTNALGGVTSYTEGTGGLVRTTTNPDGGTIIETYYGDGQLKSRTGTAVHGVAYSYDVDSPGHRITTETKLTAAGVATSEAVSSYVDWLGKPTKTVYSDTAGSSIQYSYNTVGQLAQEIDPDGVTTLYGYNLKGELTTNAIDMEGYGTIDPSGTNRITFTTNDVVSDHGVNVLRSRTYVWMTDNDDSPSLVSMSEMSTDGLQSWQTRYRDSSTPVTTHSQTVYSGTNRTVTVTTPDNSCTVTRYLNGRLSSTTQYDSTPTQIGSTTYGYDAHGRQNTVTDVRNGTMVYTFNDADLVVTVTTPDPGVTGGSPQTLTTLYSKSLEATNTIMPDSTSVTNFYLPTGEVSLTCGSRTYPVGYSYDYAGRVKSMTNWSDFSSRSGARVTTWDYDPYRGFLIGKVYADTNGPSYQYTAAGRLRIRTWARGTNTTYGYTPAGDLYTVTYDDGSTPSATCSYDRIGRMNSLVRDGMTTTLAYDFANDLLNESYLGGVLDGLSVTNGYDAKLRQTGLGALSGSSVLTSAGYTYDNASRLATVTSGTESATYSYVVNSRLVGQIAFKHGGSTKMTRTKQYDRLNRLTSISSIPTLATFEYGYNNANQRVRATLPDSFWSYGYDDHLGQVTSGKKYWNDGTPVAGEQFEYNFDDIGNRNTTKGGGYETGDYLRLAHYTNNLVNQITSRDVPGFKDITGLSLVTNAVTVNTESTYRKGEYFRKELVITNTTSPVWTNVSVVAGIQGVSGNCLVPKTPEIFSYDDDGNLTCDGLWIYKWDAENRLVSMESVSTIPIVAKKKINFAYDFHGRRIQKLVSTNNGTSYVAQYTNRFVYEGWNLIAEVAPNNSAVRTYLWGTDLSGGMLGAGGIGGLLEISYFGASTTNCFVAFNGNGDVSALINTSNGGVLASYEYGPFGETIRATGTMAKVNPFRFSTKYNDDESDLIYYGYRYLNTGTGRWLSRDPEGETGGANLYIFAGNQPITFVDPTGLQWTIKRNRQERAVATAECGDTIVDLAQRIGLDETEYRNWLQPVDGQGLPTSPSEALSGNRTFTIPNKVLFVMGGFLNWLDYGLLETRAVGLMEAAEEDGYFVKYMDYQIQPYDKNDILAQRKNLHGFMLFGHGSVDIPVISSAKPGNFVYDLGAGDNQEIGAAEMIANYHYGIVVAKFCSSGIGDWSSDASKNGSAFATRGIVTLPFIAFFRIWYMEHVLLRQSGL